MRYRSLNWPRPNLKRARSYEKLIEAALNGARLRLRSILMTSFAFILGPSAALVRLGRWGRRPTPHRHRNDRGDDFFQWGRNFLCLRSSLWLSDTNNAYEVEKFGQKLTAEDPPASRFLCWWSDVKAQFNAIGPGKLAEPNMRSTEGSSVCQFLFRLHS